MRLFILLAFLASLLTLAVAWDKEDYEIFDLVSDVESFEGKGTTFYSWLEVPPTASTAEISKAYRKKSVRLHPDKNPGVKDAHKRFARLGTVAKILRDSERRKRYDFFYKNGVPKWRGTGYYYSRFRPGVGSVIVFLTIVSSAVQYAVQRMNYRRDLERIESIRQKAKSAAWGNKLTPLEGQRKVKVNLGGPPRLDEEGNLVPGKSIDMVVEGDDVFVLESDGSLLPVDESTAIPPSLKSTWFLALVLRLFSKVTKRDSSDSGAAEDEIDEKDDSSSDAPGSGTVTPSEGSKESGRTKIKAATMAGGKRRKNGRRR